MGLDAYEQTAQVDDAMEGRQLCCSLLALDNEQANW